MDKVSTIIFFVAMLKNYIISFFLKVSLFVIHFTIEKNVHHNVKFKSIFLIVKRKLKGLIIKCKL